MFGLILSLLFSSGQVENPDTHLRLTQARIIIKDKKFGLPNDVGEIGHGNIAINKHGNRYMVYNPGQTIIFIPLYYFANLISSNDVDAYYNAAFIVSFLNFIIHSLCAFILFKIALLLGADYRQSLLVSLFFGLTSYSFVFAQSTYEHHFEMFFILASTFISLKRNYRYSSFLSALILSFGLIFRSTSIIAFPGLLFLQKDTISRMKFIFGIIPGILFVLFYNYFRFGSFFESGYSLAWSLAHSNNFDFWSLHRLPEGLFGLIFSPGKGILFFSISILISFYFIKPFWKNHRLISVSALIIVASYLCVFSLNFAWHGSIWSFGPRYILPIIPFLYFPIIYFYKQRVAYFLLFLTFLLQIELLSVNYKRDVLKEYIAYKGLSDVSYVMSIDKEPHYVQAKQFAEILPKNIGKLYNYFPNSPWKRETRTASNLDVLNSSIEKNSINFWWIRNLHYKFTIVRLLISFIFLIFTLFGSFLLFRYAKHLFR